MADQGGDNDWCTIESDPGVFTGMLEELGVSGVELAELWSLEDDNLLELGQVHGLIFLFQWDKEKETAKAANSTTMEESEIPEDLFFAHQVTTNACATQAILSVIFNAAALTTEQKGSTLAEFQSFTKDFPPSLKGVAISSSEEVKKIHNSFSRQDAFLQEGKMVVPTGDEEAFHFVAYVPINGVVYELDGLQKGPILVGSVPESEDGPIPGWLTVARSAIQERMGHFGATAIKFNLMGVIQDKRIGASDEVLAQEEAKRKEWVLENERRRHNYVPLCMAMLQELAKLGKLEKLTQEAKERQAAKRNLKKA